MRAGLRNSAVCRSLIVTEIEAVAVGIGFLVLETVVLCTLIEGDAIIARELIGGNTTGLIPSGRGTLVGGSGAGRCGAQHQ